MKRYLILPLLAALATGEVACSGQPAGTGPSPAAAPPVDAATQSSDKAYCDRLGALASRYIGSAGADGRQAPDLNVLGAITDCDKGRYEKSIPYLEGRLRGAGVTLPPR